MNSREASRKSRYSRNTIFRNKVARFRKRYRSCNRFARHVRVWSPVDYCLGTTIL